MALVWASQSFVIEGHVELEIKRRFSKRTECVKKPILLLSWAKIICDASEVTSAIEEKIKEQLKKEKDYYKDFKGEISYRKYCKPNEFYEYPQGKEFNLKIEYIKDWKMKKILEELDGNQFAILCKELGISGAEAVIRP